VWKVVWRVAKMVVRMVDNLVARRVGELEDGLAVMMAGKMDV